MQAMKRRYVPCSRCGRRRSVSESRRTAVGRVLCETCLREYQVSVERRGVLLLPAPAPREG